MPDTIPAPTIDKRDARGIGAVYSQPHRMAKLTTDFCGRIERTADTGHVVHWSSCTFYGRGQGERHVTARCSWGYRVECLHCGAVEESSHGSSVSHEDGPPRFAWAHRDCS